MNLFQEMEVNYKDFIGSANDFMESCKEFKFQENGYGKGFFEGQMRERKYWKDKIKAKIEEVKDGTYDAKIVLQSLLEKE